MVVYLCRSNEILVWNRECVRAKNTTILENVVLLTALLVLVFISTSVAVKGDCSPRHRPIQLLNSVLRGNTKVPFVSSKILSDTVDHYFTTEIDTTIEAFTQVQTKISCYVSSMW